MKCDCKSKVKGAKHYASKSVPHFENGGKVVKTTPTADGGQQYVRGKDRKEQAATINAARKAAGKERFSALAGTRAGTDIAEERRHKYNTIDDGMLKARNNLPPPSVKSFVPYTWPKKGKP